MAIGAKSWPCTCKVCVKCPWKKEVGCVEAFSKLAHWISLVCLEGIFFLPLGIPQKRPNSSTLQTCAFPNVFNIFDLSLAFPTVGKTTVVLLCCLSCSLFFRVTEGESYCNVARALVGAQLWQNALVFIGKFREEVEDDEASPAEFWREQSGDSIYQVLLSIYSRWGTWPDILRILEEAQVYPDAVTSADRSGAMRALAKLGSWQAALQVMAESTIQSDKEMLSAGMDAWVSGHHWRKVFKLLHRMEREDLVPDQQVYDNAIASCFNVAMGDSKEAGSAARATAMLLREMQQRELELTRRLWRMAAWMRFRHFDDDPTWTIASVPTPMLTCFYIAHFMQMLL